MKIKIASRSSKLALKQVEEFNKTFLIKEYDLIETSTRGDELSAKGETLFAVSYTHLTLPTILRV